MASQGGISFCPKIIIIDLDGTLIKFQIDYLSARKEALLLIMKYSFLRNMKFTLNNSIFFMDRKIKKFLVENDLSESIYKEIHDKLVLILERYEIDSAKRAKLLPSVKKTLARLKNMGWTLILFTADGENAMNVIVDKTGIKNFFDVMISRGESMEVKPHPNHIQSAISTMGSSPKEIIVVGDSVADMESGKHIGAITVGVTSGLGSPQQLAKVNVDYLIESIAELPCLLRHMHGDIDCQ
ncbi:MAG: HAD family hydrolase [Candidatus Bathyarchaeota archaeon]|nr:HAD family hydrolase [Candidatus Bathyarchaeota archaeon]